MSDSINVFNATQDQAALVITPVAVDEIKRLKAMEQNENIYLRLGVSSGGCSGMSYAMAFEDVPRDTDEIFDFDGLSVRVDRKELPYLRGCTLDYKGGMLGGGFQFSNPNAKRSCGCGTSFTC